MTWDIYVARVQSPCCTSTKEVWTVRAKSKIEAKKKIYRSTQSTIYSIDKIWDLPTRHYKCW